MEEDDLNALFEEDEEEVSDLATSDRATLHGHWLLTVAQHLP